MNNALTVSFAPTPEDAAQAYRAGVMSPGIVWTHVGIVSLATIVIAGYFWLNRYAKVEVYWVKGLILALGPAIYGLSMPRILELLAKRSADKSRRALARSGGQVEWSIGQGGISIFGCCEDDIVVPWSLVGSIIETQASYLFGRKGKWESSYYLPKRALASMESVQSFRELLQMQGKVIQDEALLRGTTMPRLINSAMAVLGLLGLAAWQLL